MIVAVNAYFKTPVAYYFSNYLPGQKKAELLCDILCALAEKNIDVCNITFDGASTNIKMVETLDTNISENDMMGTIMHPITKKEITVMLDGCHMLKLARNACAQHTITDMDDNEIRWEYFSRLVRIQEEQGLHLATKIRRRHIEYYNEKMKVRLAAQVLSSSVASALRTLEYDQEPQEFEEAGPTRRFCQQINDIFDILNSRHMYDKNPNKHAMTIENIEEFKIKIQVHI